MKKSHFAVVIIVIGIAYCMGLVLLRRSDLGDCVDPTVSDADVRRHLECPNESDRGGEAQTLSSETIRRLVRQKMERRKTEDNLFNRVNTAIAMGYSGEALRMLQEGIATRPADDVPIQDSDDFLFAQIHLQKGEMEEAISLLEKIAGNSSSPFRENASLTLGVLYATSGRLQEARRHKADPAILAHGYSKAYSEMDDEDKALALLKESAEQFEGEARRILLARQIEILVNRGEIRRALALMIEEARREPADRQADIMHGIEKVKEALGEQD